MGQTLTAEVEEVIGDDAETVLQHVVRSDTQRERALRDAERLLPLSRSLGFCADMAGSVDGRVGKLLRLLGGCKGSQEIEARISYLRP